MPFLTRLAYRLKDACDEYIERIEDSQSGHRDKYGRKTQLWHEREYERERRRRKREAKQREKEMVEGKGKKIEAVMSGAMPKGGSDGDVTLVEEVGVHGETGIVSREEQVEDPEHMTREGERDVSSMPSKHSISSIQAEVHNRRAEQRAKAGTEAGKEGPKDSEDEEEEKSDDEGSEEEDEAAKAAKEAEEPAGGGVATSSSRLRGGGGGEVAELDEEGSGEDEYFSLDEEEYNEHEDFDDEYATINEQPPSRNAPVSELGDQKNVEDEHQAPKDLNEEQTRPKFSSAASNLKHEEYSDNDSDHRCENPHEEHTGLEQLKQAEGTLGSKHEEQGQQAKRPNDQPQDCKNRVHSNTGKSGQAEGIVPSQPNGKPPNRTPRPYALPSVQDTLRVVRPTKTPDGPGEGAESSPMVINPISQGDATIGNKQQQDARETSRAKPKAKEKAPPRREKASRPNTRARKASEPTQDGPSEYWARARGKHAGLKERVAHTHEERVSDKFQPGPGFVGAIPQSYRFFHDGPYSSYGDYPRYEGPSYGGQYAPRYGRYGGENAARGRYGESGSTYQSYRALRFSKNHSQLRGRSYARSGVGRKWTQQPESSSGESFSSDSRTPSPSPPPKPRRKGARRRPNTKPFPSPPPRHTRRGAGRTPLRDRSAPPKYNNVDSVKEAPPNYYALLGLDPYATPKEIEVASRKKRARYHPDKLLPLGHNKTEEEVAKIRAKAGRVAQAAEILKDPIQRAKYNMDVRIWKRRHGGVLPAEEED